MQRGASVIGGALKSATGGRTKHEAGFVRSPKNAEPSNCPNAKARLSVRDLGTRRASQSPHMKGSLKSAGAAKAQENLQVAMKGLRRSLCAHFEIKDHCCPN